MARLWGILVEDISPGLLRFLSKLINFPLSRTGDRNAPGEFVPPEGKRRKGSHEG